MSESSTTDETVSEKAPRRRRLAISLRALLGIVLVVGLALGWKINQVREQQRVVKAIREAGGFVRYDWEIVNGQPAAGQKPGGPKWLRRLIGDEFFQEVAWVNFVYDDDGKGGTVENPNRDAVPMDLVVRLRGVKTVLLRGGQANDKTLAKLASIESLEDLFIWDGASVTDAGVARLSSLRNLKQLHLSNSGITDESLRTLAKLPRLEKLQMQGSRFTDAGLEHLANHPRLKSFYVGLGPTNITDVGLAHLRGIKTLEILDLQGANITDEGVRTLADLPKLRAVWLGNTAKLTPAGKAWLQGKLTALQAFY